MTLSIPVVLGVAVALFSVGVFGLIWRRDATGALSSVVLMAVGACLGLVSAAWQGDGVRPGAHALALFVVAVAAAETAVGLTLARRARSRVLPERDGDGKDG